MTSSKKSGVNLIGQENLRTILSLVLSEVKKILLRCSSDRVSNT